jgi:hypothetical protein
MSVLTIGTSLFLKRISNPQPEFTEHRKGIVVAESKLVSERGENENWVIVFGVVTNQTQFGWKGLEFDCRFFDTNGTMVDAKTIITSFSLLGVR